MVFRLRSPISTCSARVVAFPEQLGPLGVLSVNIELTLERSVGGGGGGGKAKDEGLGYSVSLTGALSALQKLGFLNTGRCSPLAPLPPGWPHAPEKAVAMCWAYPMDGMATVQQESRLAFLALTRQPELCFAAYGAPSRVTAMRARS